LGLIPCLLSFLEKEWRVIRRKYFKTRDSGVF
jgi:hypothetical protein